MKKEKPLTIDIAATRARLKADERPYTAWARLRGLPKGTVQRIMSGTYPHTENLETEYQKVLRLLKRDGYLVEVRQTQCAA